MTESSSSTSRAPQTPSGGAVLAHYRLERELGRGGQGAVFLAEDLRLKRKVALKVLTAYGPGAEAAMERFRREAEVASRLDHPGICGVHDAGVAEGTPYIAMHFVEGRTLAEVVAAAKAASSPDTGPTMIDLATGLTQAETSAPAPRPLVLDGDIPRPTIPEFVSIFERAARALHAAHEAGVVHRDIKPGNIMLDRSGAPVILDFGLAHADSDDLRTLTRTGDLCGTPAYMSPEQLTGQRIRLDRRTDVYSLGVTMFECFTLHRPFEAPTRQALYQAVLTKAPPDARRLAPKLPVDLKVVLETALEKDRDRRYQTAADLAEDLRRVLAGEPILARPVGPLGRFLRWSRREPAKAALLAVVVTALPVIAALVTAHVKDRPALEFARSTQLQQERESLLAQASWELSEGEPAAAAALYDRILAMEGDVSDAVAGRALLHLRLREPESALRLLDKHPALSGYAAARLRADALLQLGRTKEAEEAAGRAPLPRDAVDHAFLAMATLNEGENTREQATFAAAVRHATRAVLLAPAPRLDYFVLRAHAAAHALDDTAANDTAEALRRHWPKNIDANFFAGFAWNAQRTPRRLGDVVAAFQEVLAVRPNFSSARYNLGNALVEMGETERAIAFFRESSAAFPQDPDLRIGLANALTRAGRIAEADEAFREAKRLTPEHPEPLGRLAAAFNGTGRHAEALETIERVIKLRPDVADFHACRGQALVELRRHDEAIAALNEALRISPGRAECFHLLGLAHVDTGDFERAKAAFRTAIACDPRDVESRANIAIILDQAGDRPAAIRELDEALRASASVAPNLAARLHRERARMLHLSGDHAASLADCAKALALVPDDADVRFNQGEALRALGRFAEAADAFRECARLQPTRAEAHCNLGLCLRRSGRTSEALEALRRGHELGSARPDWRYPSRAWLDEIEAAVRDAAPTDPESEARLRDGTAASNAAEEARLARILYARGAAAPALRRFEAAFAADPALAEDLASRNRFFAAGAALQLATATTDEAAAAALRLRAAAWITADVEALCESEPSGKEALPYLVAHTNDPGIATVRGARLAQLPAATQEAFAAAWKLVDELESGR